MKIGPPRNTWLILFLGLTSTAIVATLAHLGVKPDVLQYYNQILRISNALCCALIAHQGFMAAPASCKPTRKWLAVSFGLFFLGQTIRSGEVLLKLRALAGLPLLITLAGALSVLIAILTALPSNLSRKEHEATILDFVSLSLGIISLIFALIHQQLLESPLPIAFFLVSFPSLYLTSACLGLVVMLRGKFRLPLPQLFLLLIVALTGAVCLKLTLMHAFHHHQRSTHPSHYIIDVIYLFTALAASEWINKPLKHHHSKNLCDFVLRLLPLSVVILALFTLSISTHVSSPMGLAIQAGASMSILIAFFRQTILIQQQEEFLEIELKLIARQNHIRQIVDHTSDIIFGIKVGRDGSFRYLSNNRSGREIAIHGGNFIGMQPHDFFPKEYADRFVENYRRCVYRNSPIIYEQLIPSPSSPIWVETTLIPFHNEGGQVYKLLGISRNISKYRQELEASRALQTVLQQRIAERTLELNIALRDMEHFTHAVSHDLRAPVRSITGFCNILIDHYSPIFDDQGKKYLERISRAGQRMGEIIDDLLRFSKISRTKLNLTQVDLSRMASKICSDLQISAAQRKVQFRITEGLHATGDAPLLLSVLENLLGNAWKYTGRVESAIIDFGVTSKDNVNAFFVRDNGAGFAMEYSEKLFQLFQRLHDTSEFEGNGIGLAIVARIIERHHGKVWAESTPGKGATFYFTLGTSRAISSI